MRSALNTHVIRTKAWLYRALFCFCFLFAFSYLRIHHFTNGCTVPLEKTRFSIWRNLKGGKCSCCVYLLSMETSHCDSVMVKVANCPRHIRSLSSGFEIRTFPCYLTASVLSNHKTIKDFDHQRLSRTQIFMFIQNGPIPTFRISVFSVPPKRTVISNVSILFGSCSYHNREESNLYSKEYAEMSD